MLLNILFIALLILYFWYFYTPAGSARLRSPKSTLPTPAKSSFLLEGITHTEFKLLIDNHTSLEYTLPPTHWVHIADQKIIERDDCQTHPNRIDIPARGRSLYRYLEAHPFTPLSTRFKKNGPRTAYGKDVFYFTCENRRIARVSQCESGKVFQNHHCVDVSACTGLPDQTKLPHLGNPAKYILCGNGKEYVRDCGPSEFFFHTGCVSKFDLDYYCLFHPDTLTPLKLDDRTLLECRRHRPVKTRCPPGTRLFENGTVCESEACAGLPDRARIPQGEQRSGPFRFWSGYVECRGGKVAGPVVTCPQSWDHRLTKGEDVTSLPMVFDGTECAVPTFCENVFADDPETIVPAHHFTKYLRNWQHSWMYDLSEGFVCEKAGGKSRKRAKRMDDGVWVDPKTFREKSACTDPWIRHVPLLEKPESYYDCVLAQTERCPLGQFFNGDACQNRPRDYAFKHRGLPIFEFDSINAHGWIKPWDTKPKSHLPPHCQQGYTFLKVYDVCSHPECEKYAFLAMVPELSILLPTDELSKCQFDPVSRHLKLEGATDLQGLYTYWNQRLWSRRDDARGDGPCRFGQNLETGFFVWDKTVFATCDYEQPFVFCPSPKTHAIEKISDHVYACAPPQENEILLETPYTWTPFVDNEVKRIRPSVWDPANITYRFRLNKKDTTVYDLLEDGFFVHPGVRVNLHVNHPVKLDLRYRVTFPPNVAYRYYESTNQRETLWDENTKVAFNVKHAAFENKRFEMPIFTTVTHVRLDTAYHP